ncbi:ssDNA-binding protein, mitochondrial [Gnomoniopsis sp. IMI 355080]|nr:ssDNA-binding protein, mitochondrial [Gnomoniopsis sp. IMI 355080]
MSFLARRVVAAPRFARAFSSTPTRPLAKITIVGNLAGPPELSATSTGREILKYAVASNTGRGENAKTSWFRITSFENEGPRRDYLQSLPKGTLVYVEGEASISQWEDSEGKNRSTMNIVQRNVEVLRRPSGSGEEASS